jgi:hypothetical protein
MDQLERSLRSALASALLLVVGTLSESVKAEEDYRFTNDVVLTDVRVSLVETSGRAQIVFVLENRSAERIRFGGIMVTGARHSRIVASLGNGATTTLDSVPVAPGEVVSADGEALWIEIDGLPSLPGGVIEATVNFETAVIPISLTVKRGSKPSS